jgi:hypothetical protein
MHRLSVLGMILTPDNHNKNEKKKSRQINKLLQINVFLRLQAFLVIFLSSKLDDKCLKVKLRLVFIIRAILETKKPISVL